MFIFAIYYTNDLGNQRYIISAKSRQDFENQLINFLRRFNLTREQITIECISGIL